jgi:hypothetical protein
MVNRNLLRQYELPADELQHELGEIFNHGPADWLPAEAQDWPPRGPTSTDAHPRPLRRLDWAAGASGRVALRDIDPQHAHLDRVAELEAAAAAMAGAAA